MVKVVSNHNSPGWLNDSLRSNLLEELTNAKNPAATLKALEKLKEGARNGDEESIDMLLRVAIRDDEVGNAAEDIFFDFFSRKEKSDADSDLFKNKCIDLYLEQRNGKEKYIFKFSFASQLSYVACAAAASYKENGEIVDAKVRDELAHKFLKLEGLESINKLHKPESDIFGNQRLMTGDEITLTLEKLSNNEIYFAPLLPIHNSRSNDETMLFTNAQAVKNDSQHIGKTLCFPITIASEHADTGDVVGRHHILFIIEKLKNNNKAIIFDPQPKSGVEKPFIMEELKKIASKVFHIKDKNIIFCADNLQENARDTCGPHLIEVGNRLIANPEMGVEKILRDYSIEVNGDNGRLKPKDAEQMKQLLLPRRHQAYGGWLREKRNKLAEDATTCL